MEQNTLCLTCVYRPCPDEAYLALLMLSLAAFHGLTMTGAWRELLGNLQNSFALSYATAFTLTMAVLAVLPGML